MSGHHHRSLFKQSNKAFKGTSKAKARRNQGGKVEKEKKSVKINVDRDKKSDRVNQAKQRALNKREELMDRNRVGVGLEKGPPKIIALVAMSETADVDSAGASLIQYMRANEAKVMPVGKTNMRSFTFRLDRRRQHICLLTAKSRRAEDVLDMGKVADVVLLVFAPHATQPSSEPGIDAHGERLLHLLKAQGIPNVLGVLQGLASIAPKHHGGAKKTCSRYVDTQMPGMNAKVMPLDSISSRNQSEAHVNSVMSDAANVFRYALNQKPKEVSWRHQRAYMLAEAAAFQPSASDPSKGTIMLSGFLRGGKPLSADQLVHLTGVGDFRLAEIRRYMSLRSVASEQKEMAEEKMDSSTGLPIVPLPPAPTASVPGPRAESLCGLKELDPLAVTEYDQSIITEEEMKGSKAKQDTGEAWAAAVSDNGDDDNSGDEKEMADAEPDQSNTAGLGFGSETPFGLGAHADDDDGASMAGDVDDTLTHAGDKKKLERDEVNFPDEVETPYDVPAQQRFARYRGLQNFRSSTWNKYEMLPVSYSQIYTFQHFEATRKRAMGLKKLPGAVTAAASRAVSRRPSADESALTSTASGGMVTEVESTGAGAGGAFNPGLSDTMDFGTGTVSSAVDISGEAAEVDLSVLPLHFNGVSSGSHVVLLLADVPAAVAALICDPTRVICAWGLFEHERKVSLVHCLVRRSVDDIDEPVKGKQAIEVHCGFRRFTTRPVFSQNTKGDKHLVERFLQKGRFTVASFFGRVTFPPAPVLMFRARDGEYIQGAKVAGGASVHAGNTNYVPGSVSPIPLKQLMASGTLLTVDPHRLLIKRIVLTGYPVDVHKRHAVIRYMFFNPDDIRYFKPVELWTRHGLTGQIRESRGTKGYMKCMFSDRINQNDIVCMSLYKRQYPPFNAADWDESKL